MLIFKDKKFQTVDSQDNSYLLELGAGDKIWYAKDPYDEAKCIEIDAQLQQSGLKTRVARNPENKMWSIAILET